MSYEEHIMAKDKYPSTFSRQMEAIVFLSIFRNTRGFQNLRNINLLLTEREGRTGEYWHEVVTVRTEHREVRTKTTECRYSPVRLQQARLVEVVYYMAVGSCYISFFRTHFRSVKFRELPARDNASNSERTS